MVLVGEIHVNLNQLVELHGLPILFQRDRLVLFQAVDADSLQQTYSHAQESELLIYSSVELLWYLDVDLFQDLPLLVSTLLFCFETKFWLVLHWGAELTLSGYVLWGKDIFLHETLFQVPGVVRLWRQFVFYGPLLNFVRRARLSFVFRRHRRLCLNLKQRGLVLFKFYTSL